MYMYSSFNCLSVTQNPEWMQEVSFGIGEHHNYVNVCVWVKLGEERGNLLVGHVCYYIDS